MKNSPFWFSDGLRSLLKHRPAELSSASTVSSRVFPVSCEDSAHLMIRDRAAVKPSRLSPRLKS